MSILKDIFCNQRTESGANQITQNVAEQHKGLTLGQAFMVGNSWTPARVDTLRREGTLDELLDFQVRVWKYDESEESLKDFKLYNKVDLQNAWIRAKFLKRLSGLGHMNKVFSGTLEQQRDLVLLRNLSLYAFDYASLLMPIKGFICAQGLDKEYKGLVPNTKPVRTAVEMLFGKQVYCNYEHTTQCIEISKEIDRDPMYVNTALWVLGTGWRP